jgi:hypothetical protein
MRATNASCRLHILVSRHWMLKVADIVDASTLCAEEAFFREPSHMDLVKRAFEIARIDYGRIDYAVQGDRIVVFEINTNPGHTPRRARLHAERIPLQERAVAPIVEAFRALDRDAPGGGEIPAFGSADRARVLRARVAARLLG